MLDVYPVVSKSIKKSPSKGSDILLCNHGWNQPNFGDIFSWNFCGSPIMAASPKMISIKKTGLNDQVTSKEKSCDKRCCSK